MTYEDLMELVQKRRSIRRFKTDPVPEELINKVIDVARWAPSGFNMQPWEFIVVESAELRSKIVGYIKSYREQSIAMESTRSENQGRKWKLKGMANEHGDYTTAPVYIILCGDPRLQVGLPMGAQCDRNRKRIIYLSSLSNAFLYMHLAATSLGLASQWISDVQAPYVSCMIKKLLNIPEPLELFDMIVMGYPAISPPKKFMRDVEDSVHRDRVAEGGFRSNADVEEYIRKARSWTIGTHKRKSRK